MLRPQDFRRTIVDNNGAPPVVDAQLVEATATLPSRILGSPYGIVELCALLNHFCNDWEALLGVGG